MQDEIRLVSDTDAYTGDQISHSSLADKYTGEQHGINNVTNLEARLHILEELQNLKAKNRGVAQYYAWADQNQSNEDRTGCFVSLVGNTDTITICTSKREDVFGVIVPADTTGVVGGNYDVMIDQEIGENTVGYGLVCNSGKVRVRTVDNTISVGDYVVPNLLGYAQKVDVNTPITKYHFDLIEVGDVPNYFLEYEPIDTPKVYLVNEDNYLGDEIVVGEAATGTTIMIDGAQITLDVGAGGYDDGDTLCFLYQYISNASPGYKVTETLYDSGTNYVMIDLSSSNSAMIRLCDRFNDMNQIVAAIEQNVVTAINIANIAYDSVDGNGDPSWSEGINMDTLNVIVNTQIIANNALEMSKLTRDSLEDTNELLAETIRLAEGMKDLVDETKEKADEAIDEIEDLWAENGASTETIKNLIGKVDQYSIASVSQANGLTLSQAKKIVPDGSVYVPRQNRTETYSADPSPLTYVFTRGNSYTWRNKDNEETAYWVETENNVYFSSTYVAGSDGKYWYTGDNDVENDNTTYPKETLYKWDIVQNAWVAVATLDNSLGRVVSLTQQTENEVKTEIVDARGGYASMGARIDADEVAIEDVTKLSTNTSEALTLTKQRVTNTEASITQLTEFSTKVTSTEMIDGEPPVGKYYSTEPTWAAKTTGSTEYEWKFSGDYRENAGVYELINYCYAANTSNPNTYYKYECYQDNKWARTTISVSTSMAGVIQKADANGASINSLTQWQGTTNKTLTSIQQKATKDSARIDSLVAWQDTTDTSIANIQQQATKDSARIDTIASWQGTTTTTITNIQQKATKDSARIDAIVAWQGTTDTSIANIQQQASENGARITQVVEHLGGYEQWDGTSDRDVTKIYYKDGKYYYFKDGQWLETTDPIQAGVTISAASIVSAVNSAGSSVQIKADCIELDGVTAFVGGRIEEVQNNALYDTRVEYALSTSSYEFNPVEGSDGVWSTTAPQWRTDAYMWQKTVIVKGDGTKIESDPTCIQGANGGGGRGTSGVTNYYYATETDTETLPAAGDTAWKTKVSELTNPFNETYQYLWNYEVVSYNDGTSDDPTEPTIIGRYSGDGRGVEDIIEYYIVTATQAAPETLPTATEANGWTKGESGVTLPVTSDDYPYLWNYEIIDYTDGDDSTSGPVIIGTYGNSIKGVTEYYAVTADNVAPDRYSNDETKTINQSVWMTFSAANDLRSETTPYLWNFERTEYTLAEAKDTEVALLTSSPRGIETITEYYTIKTDDSVPESPSYSDDDHNEPPTIPTEWSTDRPSVSQGDSMWNFEVIKYSAVDSDGKNLYEIVAEAIIGYGGKDGTSIDLQGVAYTTETIDDSSLNQKYSLYSDEACQNQIVSADDGDSYVVNGYLFVYSGSGSEFTCAGKLQGPRGVEGNGVSNVINYYMASSRSTGVSAGTEGETADEQWLYPDVPATSHDKPYLWNYEVMWYTDGNSEATTPTIIGMYSEDGRGISSIEEFYCVSSSSTCAKPDDDTLGAATAFVENAVEDQWYTTTPTTSSTLKYLWNCERITYTTDPTVEIFEPALIGTHGASGATIKATKTQYYLSSSSTELAGGEWSDYPANFTENHYMWTRLVFTMTDGSTIIEGDPVFDSTFTTIANWCDVNDTTLIDGAHIATGTIDAKSIKAHSITADEIEAGTITANEIATNTITADHMTTDSIDAIAARVGTVVTNTIRNEHSVTDTSTSWPVYMTSPTTLNTNISYMTDATSSFVYVGTDGVGTIKYTNLDGSSNGSAIKHSSYMYNGMLYSNSIVAEGGWIGTSGRGFSISGSAIRNEYDLTTINAVYNHNDFDRLYMKSYRELNQNSNFYNGLFIAPNGGELNRDYVYIGTDGIGTYHINSFTTDGITSASQTYMSNGELYSNSATITGNITASSGYIGDTFSGFEIGSSSIYSRLLSTYDQKTYHMISPYGFKKYDSDIIDPQAGGIGPNAITSYVYIGTNGVGTMTIEHISKLGDVPAHGEILANTYMSDGKLFSNSAEITGKITAKSGYIGNIIIEKNGITSRTDNGNVSWSLDNTGLHVPSTSGYVEVGNLKITNKVEDNMIKTTMRTNGDLNILSANDSGIKLGQRDGTSDKEDVQVALLWKRADNILAKTTTIYAIAVVDSAPKYDVVFDVDFKSYAELLGVVVPNTTQTKRVRFIIPAGEKNSGDVKVFEFEYFNPLESTCYYHGAQLQDKTWKIVEHTSLKTTYDYIAAPYGVYANYNWKEDVCVVGHLSTATSGAYDIGSDDVPWRAVYTTQLFINDVNIGDATTACQNKIATLESKVSALEAKLK